MPSLKIPGTATTGSRSCWKECNPIGAALGTRIRIEVATAEGTRNIYTTVGTRSSALGGSSLQQEIGLGQATAIEAVEVTWPDHGRTRQLFTDLEMDQYYRIREGDRTPVRLDRR